MADHAVWRGHLRLALVSCPVALMTAHHEATSLHFHFINPETGNRVRMVTLDAETDQELSRRDLVRGYEYKKGQYLVMNDEDFESARIDSSSVLNVEKFVAADAIDPIYYDSTYYLVPDGEAGADVYVVLREAIVQSKRVALSRIVISRRERAVAIMPMGRGLVVHTLHDSRDLHDPQAAFSGVAHDKADPEMVKLATLLVDRQTGPFDAADMDDRYAARLREVIEAKLHGKGVEVEQEPEPDRGNVVDLMAALKRSLAGGDAAGDAKAPAAAKPAAKPAKASGTKASEEKPAAGKPAAKAGPAKSAAKPARRRA